MACQILVSNKSSIPRSEIIIIKPADHKWGRLESMQEFISSGGDYNEWPRTFSIVKVTDKNENDLIYLLDSEDEGLNKWHFKEPDPTNELYIELYKKGEVSASWDIVSQFLVSR